MYSLIEALTTMSKEVIGEELYKEKKKNDWELGEPQVGITTFGENSYKNRPKGGFFDLPKDNTCRDPEHNPPTHICIPQGRFYRHVCPRCGQVTDLIPPQVSF